MFKTRYLVLMGVAIAALAMVFLRPVLDSEPRYGGHSLSHWLAQYGNTPRNFDASNAVWAIGTNAYPFLAERALAKDKRIIEFLREEIGLNLARPAVIKNAEAEFGFKVIGPQLWPWIPGLTPGLTNLQGISPLVLGAIGEPALKAVISSLQSDDSQVRLGAAYTFVFFDCDTRPAKTTLSRALEDPDRRIRTVAALALSKMKPQHEPVAVFLQGLKSTNEVLIISSMKGFGFMNPVPTSAFPALVEATRSSSMLVRANASNLISQIQPSLR